MKRFAFYAALVFATVAGALLLWLLRDAILLFALALALASTLRPIVDFLVAHRVRRSLSVAAVYLGMLTVVFLVVALLGVPLLVEARRGADALMRAYDSASGSQESLLRQVFIERLPASAELYRALGSRTPGSGAEALFSVALTTAGLAGRAAIVLVMSIYWLANRDAFEHWGLSLLASESRVRARETWRAAKAAIGVYLRAQLAQSVVTMALLDLGFHAIGLRYPTLPAVVGGLGRFVPVIGVPFAVLSAILAGLANGPGLAVSAGVLSAAIFLLVAAVGTRLFPQQRYSAILEIVVMVALADAYGVPGLFAAAPLAAVIHIVGSRLMSAAQPLASADLSGVAQRLAALRARIAQSSSVPPAIVSVVERLDGLISSAKELNPIPPSSPSS